MINRLTLEAEAWAESGTSKIGELPFRREVLPPGQLRASARAAEACRLCRRTSRSVSAFRSGG